MISENKSNQLTPSAGKHSAEVVISRLKKSSPYLQEINDQFLTGLRRLKKVSRNKLEADILKIVEKTVPLILALHHEDYARLMGTFNVLRKDGETSDLSDRMAELIKNSRTEECRKLLIELKTVFEGANELARSRAMSMPDGASLVKRLMGKMGLGKTQYKIDMQLAADALVLIRTVYPAGVNMISPEWTENNSCSAASAVEVNKLAPRTTKSKEHFVPRDEIKIEPYGAEASIITYQHRERFVESSFPIIIREGESILIGRDLGVRGLFGIENENNPILRYSIKGRINDSSVSRAGLIIFRLDNRIFVFNRGSMNNYQISENFQEMRTVTSFAGNSKSTGDGFYKFGSAQKTMVVPDQAHLSSAPGYSHVSAEFTAVSGVPEEDSQIIVYDELHGEAGFEDSDNESDSATLFTPFSHEIEDLEDVTDTEAKTVFAPLDQTYENALPADRTMPGTSTVSRHGDRFEIEERSPSSSASMYQKALPADVTVPGTLPLKQKEDAFIIEDDTRVDNFEEEDEIPEGLMVPVGRSVSRTDRHRTQVLNADKDMQDVIDDARKDLKKPGGVKRPLPGSRRTRSNTLEAPLSSELDALRESLDLSPEEVSGAGFTRIESNEDLEPVNDSPKSESRPGRIKKKSLLRPFFEDEEDS